jgi:alpha-L-fucosidase 2
MKHPEKKYRRTVFAILSVFMILSLFFISSKPLLNNDVLSIVPGSGQQDNKGSVSRDYWKNFQDDIASFSAMIDFGMKPLKSKYKPDGSDKLKTFEAVAWNDNSKTSNWDDNYAQRIYGYLIPEVTGSYMFYISGKDGNELWLSESEDPAKIQRVGGGQGSAAQYTWTGGRAQRQRGINLTAGKKYFIEARMTARTGDDYLAVAWSVPGSAKPEIIPGNVLAPYTGKVAYEAKPASLRPPKIRAEWVDRVQLSGQAARPDGHYLLWYRQPAKVWEEALPIGNGRLGAMVFGGVSDERIQLNNCDLWDGYTLDPNSPESLQSLPEVRRLLFEGKNNEAVALAGKTMMGRPQGVKSYQSLGELWFDTPVLSASDYVRSLDLSTAVVKVKYVSDEVTFTRESFASPVDGLITVQLSADKQNKINFSLTLKREKDAECISHPSDPKSILLTGKISTKDKDGNSRGLSFAAQVKAIAVGGEVTVSNGIMTVKNANSVTLLITGATNYPGLKNIGLETTLLNIDPAKVCSDIITKASSKTYDKLKSAHIAEHQRLFGRMELNLGTVAPDVLSLPTNERLDQIRNSGQIDQGLVETFFQYGRYLLISSSRPGGMPANLQGIWAWQMNAPWNADFHTNINIQMNYWPVEITNLSELHMPLFDLSEALVKPGERTAKVLYGARGWVVHHLTDAWGYTAPADGPQGIWPMGAAWLSQDPWEHYCFTGDKDFLSKRGYPLMKGAARFIIDFLVEAPAGTAFAGKLVTNPSYSPENSFFLPNGDRSVFTYGATMDLEIIYNLLTNCIDATKVLNTDAEFRAECQKTLDRLAPIRISPATGRIMEWAEDYKEVEPTHRHTSHLFGLHPGSQITVVGTPELAAAARKTLEGRGDAGTGWSLAWKINMWGRLQDGDHAFKLLYVLLSTKTLPNLFDNHPPFQIDGNFGATAAIAEMMVQSQLKTSDGNFEIQLLPALPKALPEGSVKGLMARGGFEIDMTWKDGRLANARIKSKLGGKLHLRLNKLAVDYDTKAGEILQLNKDLEKI